MVAAFAMMFSVMTSYTRARAESMIEKCKVGFMERPERIVLVMIGAFTNRMAAILWVILVLSVVTVVDRIYFTWRALQAQEASATWLGQSLLTLPLRAVWHAFYWTFDRATWQYDLMVIAILSFVWLVPPGWIGDPTASGPGLIGNMIWSSSGRTSAPRATDFRLQAIVLQAVGSRVAEQRAPVFSRSRLTKVA